MRPASEIQRRAAFMAALREVVEYHRGRIVELNEPPRMAWWEFRDRTMPETVLGRADLIAFHKRAVAAIQVVVLREEAE